VFGVGRAFSCVGIDQYSHPIQVPAISWESTGGEITPEGLFTAGVSDGAFTARAKAADQTAVAEVRISSAIEPHDGNDSGSNDPTPSTRVLRWRGAVPTQKWMNFYTKVLTKFAGVPGLKLEVAFEVTLSPEQASAKADEINMGLKELGLSGVQDS
jgi:hypothetical protein